MDACCRVALAWREGVRLSRAMIPEGETGSRGRCSTRSSSPPGSARPGRGLACHPCFARDKDSLKVSLKTIAQNFRDRGVTFTIRPAPADVTSPRLCYGGEAVLRLSLAGMLWWTAVWRERWMPSLPFPPSLLPS
ncbi:uncharacterized protein LOC135097002 isoform X4 [Scylla paramamosain]|uniref:uncharacterized protein LOC135097002 isoform X4 n=1 Tax=Scylla paramamosain TaxID=85552 RepID=UPI003082F408